MTPPPATQRKLLLWLGCSLSVFLLLLIVVGVVLFRMARRPAGEQGAVLPADWRGRLRAGVTLPREASQLAPPRTDSGNAAAVLFGMPDRLTRSRVVLERIERGQELGADDAALLREAQRDSTLDALVAAARMRSYAAVPLLLQDTVGPSRLYGVRLASLFPNGTAGSTVDLLTVRGYARYRAGQRAAALRDIQAAIGLGLMRYQREPSWSGSRRGLQSTGAAAAVLARLLERADTGTAGAARRLAEWARTRYEADLSAWRGLFAAPDSGLAALVDTLMPFPVRATMLYEGSLYWTTANPWRAFRGPPAAVWRRVHAYAESPDPDLRLLAAAADSALTRIERVGRWNRLREW
jgi:hypothetical protein